jgi:phospholipase/carboxylesterase
MTVADAVVLETADTITHSVIWLHGLGADGHDFEPIVPELVRKEWPGIRFIFPHARVRPVTINNGYAMRAWYDITSLDFSKRKEDEAGIRESIAFVCNLIAQENARGIADENIFLAGFSQGGAIVLACALRHEKSLAGVIALSTYLPLADFSQAEMSACATKQFLFMAHGTYDPVVPMQAGLSSAQHLQSLGLKPDWHTYPMPHSVCAEEIGDLQKWMHARLGMSA